MVYNFIYPVYSSDYKMEKIMCTNLRKWTQKYLKYPNRPILQVIAVGPYTSTGIGKRNCDNGGIPPSLEKQWGILDINGGFRSCAVVPP
jgi:hypothetical protein